MGADGQAYLEQSILKDIFGGPKEDSLYVPLPLDVGFGDGVRINGAQRH